MDHADAARFLLQIAALLAAALGAGQLLRRLLPPVAAEIAAGILLGPSLLGALAPAFQAWLFPLGGPAAVGREALVRMGLLCFLFAAGLEVDVALVRRRIAAVATTSLLGILLPFGIGAGAVLLLPRLWSGAAPVAPGLLACVVGTALGISALPVIARILSDLQLARTEVAAVVLAAATIDDLVGWSLLATILGVVGSGVARPGWCSALIALGLAALTVFLLRPLVARLRPWLRRRVDGPARLIGTAAVLTLVAGAVAEGLGLHAIFGAFLAGVALSQARAEPERVQESVRDFALGVGAPLYFVCLGLRVDFVAGFDPALVGLVLLLASLGKLTGASLGARLGGLPLREALAVGWGMNARGAMEVVLASVCLEHGLVDRRLFVALVVMAVVTSAASGPAMRRLLAPAHGDSRVPEPAPSRASA